MLNRLLFVSGLKQSRQQVRERVEGSGQEWALLEAESGAQALEVLYQASGIGALVIESVLPDLMPEELCGLVMDHFPAVSILILHLDAGQLQVCNEVPATVANQLQEMLTPARIQAQPELPQASLTSTGIEMVPESWSPPVPILRESEHRGLRGMVGDSKRMQTVYTLTQMVAVRDTTVLVTGESGTGKDLIAQSIHAISNRAKQPFVVVNCAAVPEALLEAELFGYTKGAFTGAMQSRIGRIHAAHGGTLFLDEIGDMPLALQSKILRFLEQGEVQRLGGNDNLKVDVRVVAATNADLKKLAQQKLFREDLYYRLAVFMIHLPPLRERPADIPKLVQMFTTKFCPGVTVHPTVIETLCGYQWPGNVRELRNAMERASILIGNDREMTLDHILL